MLRSRPVSRECQLLYCIAGALNNADPTCASYDPPSRRRRSRRTSVASPGTSHEDEPSSSRRHPRPCLLSITGSRNLVQLMASSRRSLLLSKQKLIAKHRQQAAESAMMLCQAKHKPTLEAQAKRFREQGINISGTPCRCRSCMCRGRKYNHCHHKHLTLLQ